MNNINGQIPDCDFAKVRGPLLVCGSGITQHKYHVWLPNPVSNVTWTVVPSSAGTVINPLDDNAEVQWNSNAVSQHAYLLYSYTDVNSSNIFSDTLWPQACCTPPSGAHSVRDLDDEIGTITGAQKVYDAFLIPGVPTSCSLNLATKQVLVNGGTYFIQGMLNLNTTRVTFKNCTLYMGSGAVIYTPHGHSSIPSSSLGDFVAQENTHFLGTPCGMWRGIITSTDTKLYFANSTIEDAEYAIKWDGCDVALTCYETNFNNNYISIYTQHILSSAPNRFQNLGPDPSTFRNCVFDSQSPMTLPVFNGQRGIPAFQKPFAAMYYNDLVQSPTNGLKSIPFDENPGVSCIIRNMPFGIYGVNSQIDVFNVRFNNIQPATSCYYKSCKTAAISSLVKPGISTKQLNVGGDDIPNQLNLHNEFTDCYFGVRSQGNINSNILYNVFTHNDLGSTTKPSGRAIMLLDANNNTIKVNQNHIIDHKIVSNSIAFNSTGILISNSGQFRQNLEIMHNTIDNNRIGIYLSNISGSNLITPDFHVAFNSINSTIPENLLTGTHFGMFLSNVNNAVVESNWITRYLPLSTSPNFQTKMYGMNNVNCTNSIIAANYFQKYGTSMRYVSSNGGTQLRCNSMNNCIQGISLANASMSNQGSASDPWDNTWDGFPTPTNNTYNRVDGVAPPIDWYYRGNPNSPGFVNSFSPEPVDPQIIYAHPLPNFNGISCQGGSGGSNNATLEHLLDIVSNNITYPNYPDEERYNNEEYAYRTLMEDAALIASENEFIQFLSEQENTNREYFRQVDDYVDNENIADAIALLNLIVDDNVIEHNKHFTKAIALRLLVDPDAIITEAETEELQTIAWTSAWEGGSGVFTARHILDEEVFDVERNLRIGHRTDKSVADIRFSIYPNPVVDKLIVYHNIEDKSEIKLIVYDFMGKPVLEASLKDNKVDISKLNQGIYTFSFFIDGNYNSSAKITVLK